MVTVADAWLAGLGVDVAKVSQALAQALIRIDFGVKSAGKALSAPTADLFGEFAAALCEATQALAEFDAGLRAAAKGLGETGGTASAPQGVRDQEGGHGPQESPKSTLDGLVSAGRLMILGHILGRVISKLIMHPIGWGIWAATEGANHVANMTEEERAELAGRQADGLTGHNETGVYFPEPTPENAEWVRNFFAAMPGRIGEILTGFAGGYSDRQGAEDDASAVSGDQLLGFFADLLGKGHEMLSQYAAGFIGGWNENRLGDALGRGAGGATPQPDGPGPVQGGNAPGSGATPISGHETSSAGSGPAILTSLQEIGRQVGLIAAGADARLKEAAPLLVSAGAAMAEANAPSFAMLPASGFASWATDNSSVTTVNVGGVTVNAPNSNAQDIAREIENSLSRRLVSIKNYSGGY